MSCRNITTIACGDSSANIILMDSVSYMEEAYAGDIIVCGSHGGESAAAFILRYSPRGVIFNDAGIGKENAGIRGLTLFQLSTLPAAAVGAHSARIGEGMDTYNSGIISAINEEADKCGITIGMRAKEAAMKMVRAIEFCAGKR